MHQSSGTTEPGINIQFMLPGFSKCGSTTLYALLDEHPSLCMSSTKEPNFFIRDDYLQHWDYYRNLFPPRHNNLLLGEATTMYSSLRHEESSRDRMLRHFPALKLIFVARDPLKRIESSFREFHHSGHDFGVSADFDANVAIRQFPALLDDTLYYQRWKNYAERVPAERILVVFLEDLIADTGKELRRCFDFLGVDPAPATTIPLRALNCGEEKLRDSRLLRYLRHHPLSSRTISKLQSPRHQNVLRAIGLRQPFTQKIAWDDATLAVIANTLVDDTQKFLALNGKPFEFWPAFARIANAYC